MNTILEFSIDLEHAWADIHMNSGKSRITAVGSNDNDFLGDIVRGLDRIATVPGKFEVLCDTENRGYFLISFRRFGGQFELTVKKETNNCADVDAARNQRVRFRHRGDWPQALCVVVEAYEQLREKLGHSGYETMAWHAYPTVEIVRLREHLRKPPNR